MKEQLEQLQEMIEERWRSLAWRQPESGLYYFVLTSDFNNRVVMPAWGSDVHEARRRLEGSLRTLGCQGRLAEFEAGELRAPVLPSCPDCEATMIPEDRFLFGMLQRWRCGAYGCWRRIITVWTGTHAPEPQSAIGAGSPYDVSY